MNWATNRLILSNDENPAQLIVNALSPAKVVSATADDEEKKAEIIVSEQQLSLAIGKSGQNVRLAAKLQALALILRVKHRQMKTSTKQPVTKKTLNLH